MVGDARMAEPTIWKLEPHTEVKHAIYDRYLDAWLPIILRKWPVATYAEGFAGPGVYEEGQRGSPIRALHRYRNAQSEHAHLHRKMLRDAAGGDAPRPGEPAD